MPSADHVAKLRFDGRSPGPTRLGNLLDDDTRVVTRGCLVAIADNARETQFHGAQSVCAGCLGDAGEVNAARIAACVNACSGFPTQVLLDQEFLDAVAELRKVATHG